MGKRVQEEFIEPTRMLGRGRIAGGRGFLNRGVGRCAHLVPVHAIRFL
jgi:hypothetical protein